MSWEPLSHHFRCYIQPLAIFCQLKIHWLFKEVVHKFSYAVQSGFVSCSSETTSNEEATSMSTCQMHVLLVFLKQLVESAQSVFGHRERQIVKKDRKDVTWVFCLINVVLVNCAELQEIPLKVFLLSEVSNHHFVCARFTVTKVKLSSPEFSIAS